MWVFFLARDWKESQWDRIHFANEQKNILFIFVWTACIDTVCNFIGFDYRTSFLALSPCLLTIIDIFAFILISLFCLLMFSQSSNIRWDRTASECVILPQIYAKSSCSLAHPKGLKWFLPKMKWFFDEINNCTCNKLGTNVWTTGGIIDTFAKPQIGAFLWYIVLMADVLH